METTTEKTPAATEKKTYNPLGGAVNDKSYSTPPSNGQTSAPVADIPEPSFTPPPIAPKQKERDPFEEERLKMQEEQRKKVAAQQQTPPPFNPQLNNLPQKQREESAQQLTKLIMKGYERLHDFGNWMLQISERKMYKLQKAGEVNMTAPVPYDYDKTMTVGEFVKTYNDQVKGTFTVDREFKKDVEPVLTRVLAKRGHGLSDENMLMIMFGQDIAVKGMIFMQMRQQVGQIIDFAKEHTQSMKKQKTQPPPPAPEPVYEQQPVYEQPVQQQPVYQQPPQPAYQEPLVQQPIIRTPLETQNEFTGANAPHESIQATVMVTPDVAQQASQVIETKYDDQVKTEAQRLIQNAKDKAAKNKKIKRIVGKSKQRDNSDILGGPAKKDKANRKK